MDEINAAMAPFTHLMEGWMKSMGVLCLVIGFYAVALRILARFVVELFKDLFSPGGIFGKQLSGDGAFGGVNRDHLKTPVPPHVLHSCKDLINARD